VLVCSNPHTRLEIGQASEAEDIARSKIVPTIVGWVADIPTSLPTVFDTTHDVKNQVQRLDTTGKRRKYGPKTKKWMAFKKKVVRKENLIFVTIFGVGAGIALGAGLYSEKPSKRAVELIGETLPSFCWKLLSLHRGGNFDVLLLQLCLHVFCWSFWSALA
jgi:hypothetical protein